MGIHWQELVIILVIVLVLFGPRRLPEIGRSLGSGIKEFKDGMTNSGKSDAGKPVTVNAEVVEPATSVRAADAVPSDTVPPRA